jgi:hypothetical protein
MKLAAITLCVAAMAVFGKAALAQQLHEDYLTWLHQCTQDKKAGTSDQVILRYCICFVNLKVGNNEIRSVTEWEKANPEARRACERESELR